MSIKGVVIGGIGVLIAPYVLGAMGLGLIVGPAIEVFSHVPIAKQALIAANIRADQNTFSGTPVQVGWSTEGDSKVMTVRVQNLTGEAWDKFEMWCPTNKGKIHVTDLSGLMPHEDDTRSYAIENTTVVRGTGACELSSPRRGKPRAYDAAGAFERGDSGWGDRVLSEGSTDSGLADGQSYAGEPMD